AVAADTELYRIRAELFNDDGSSYTRWSTVKAGAAGVLSSFAVLKGQMVSVGEETGQVAPPSFSVTASLAPEQLYRLIDQPTEALVTVTGAPAPFTCTGLTITTPLAGSGNAADRGAGSGTTLRCAVPGDVRVFSGLTAKVTIAGGIAENVLTVPLT